MPSDPRRHLADSASSRYTASVSAAWAVALCILVVGIVIGVVIDHRVFVGPSPRLHAPELEAISPDDELLLDGQPEPGNAKPPSDELIGAG
jgi:hypothetical protein